MPATLEIAHEIAELTPTPSVKKLRTLPEVLHQYKLQPGHPALPGCGRPKGSRNRLSAMDILKRRETRIAKRYVDRAEQSDTVLIDAMKHLMPKDAESARALNVVIFAGSGELLPRMDGPQQVVSSLPDNATQSQLAGISDAGENRPI